MFLSKRFLRCLAILSTASLTVFSSAQTTSYFVDGTYAGDTRYNVKKLFDGNDDNLCWAASASNIIDLWQSRNSAYLPGGVPHGQTQAIYSSDVFYTFVHSFRDGGGFEEDGVSWWLNGEFLKKFTYQMRTDPLSTGGYYSSWGWIGPDIVREVKIDASKNALLDLLAYSLDNDFLLTMGIYGGRYGDSAHAISLWGYALDDLSGELTGLWIGDSDSSDIGNVLVDIVWNEDSDKWYLTGDYEDWYIDDVTQFGAPMIPEPLYGAFLFGGVALAVLTFRRRRAGVAVVRA